MRKNFVINLVMNLRDITMEDNQYHTINWMNTRPGSLRVQDRWVIPRECHPKKRPKWDSFWQVMVPLSILLLATMGAKLIGPQGGLQVAKQKVCQVTGSVESPLSNISLTVFVLLDKRFIGVIPRECHPEKRPKWDSFW